MFLFHFLDLFVLFYRLIDAAADITTNKWIITTIHSILKKSLTLKKDFELSSQFKGLYSFRLLTPFVLIVVHFLITRETRNRYPLGNRVEPPLQCDSSQTINHTGEVTNTRQARCNELDLKGKPLAFTGKGFQT